MSASVDIMGFVDWKGRRMEEEKFRIVEGGVLCWQRVACGLEVDPRERARELSWEAGRRMRDAMTLCC